MPETKDRGAPKAYTVTAKSFHDGRLYRGGETIMLYDDEVGPHHALIVPRQPEAPQLSASPVKVKRARKAKPPAMAPAPDPVQAELPKSEEAPVAKKRDRKAKPLA